jgi:pimeloyl-ACP methyl ester carboxylesterase
MVSHRDIEVGSVRLRVAEAGEGPLVVLLHGFPESWYSWRHQFGPLAAAGLHVVAPDQRGYGGSDRPARVDAYTIMHLVGDVIGLVHALGEQHAVVIGHDWGAPVAWAAAQLRPDVVTAVAGLSVPPTPRSPAPPLQILQARFGGRFYWNVFQPPGIVDASLAADVDDTLRRFLYALSGDNPGTRQGAADLSLVPDGGRFLDGLPRPAELPPWLTEADLATFVESFTASGFTGGLNWYRNIDRNWELTAAWQHAPIQVPALHLAGDRDLIYALPGTAALVAALPSLHPQMRDPIILPGCGHWIQQERPTEVNAALLDFIAST